MLRLEARCEEWPGYHGAGSGLRVSFDPTWGDILSRGHETAGRSIRTVWGVGTIGAIAMTRDRARRRRGAHIMSAGESAWLAWYMCAVSLMMTALGLLFLIASRSRSGAPVF